LNGKETTFCDLNQDKNGEAVKHCHQDDPGEHPKEEETKKRQESDPRVGLILNRLDRFGRANQDSDDGNDGGNQGTGL
jgi:hypothetical protein